MSRPKKSVSIGPLSNKSSASKHYVPERIVFDIPERITNSGVKEPFTGVQWQTRPGSDLSFIRSFGQLC